MINLEQDNQRPDREWLAAQVVMERLGVRPQTLYAYVSRGRIEAKPDPSDPRRSLYRAADVARLAHRKARGRRDAAIAEDAIAWGEPVLASAITTVVDGRLWYRGRDAAKLSETARLEDVARLLWACGEARFPPQRHPVAPGSAQERMFGALAARAANDGVMGERTPRALYLEAAAVLDLLVDSVAGGPGEGPIHQRLARAWRCDQHGADLLRRALVLLADHELNASTFAVRVTASTRASLAACALAGLSALSGPLHGWIAARLCGFLAEGRDIGFDQAVRARLANGLPLPGFGHPLYPDGDPRAIALLAAFTPQDDHEALRRAVETLAGQRPNIDYALVGMTSLLGLPVGTTFQVFAIARCTGWIAHALEQLQASRLIRPRARYTGPPLERATGH